MKLSIVSVFCDNDYTLVYSLLENIKDKVKVSHEVILIDNREQYKNEPLKLPYKVEIYSKGYNAYQFEARRFAVQFCKGEYIWFIDTDDSLLTVEESLNDINGNLVCFSYVIKTLGLNLPDTWDTYKSFFFGSDRISVCKAEIERKANFWDVIGSTLWNKWIKRDFFIDIISDIPENTVIVASEDILYSALCYERSEQITLCKDSIYIYNYQLSKANNKEMTAQRFFHIIKGRKESRILFRKLLSDGDKYDDIKQSAAYFVGKLSYCKEDIDSCVKELLNHFSKEEVKDCLTHPWIEELSDKRKDKIHEIFEAL